MILTDHALANRSAHLLRRAIACFPLLMAAAQCGLTADNGGSQQDGVMLETVIVTGVRDVAKKEIAKNITVIDQADIEASTATQLIELLSKEANVTLRTFTGNDKYGGIDIRGMGATSVSNVLVLVDGVRLNNDDLSGPDLSSVPISQIERIEIVRSGGAVRYGNGAVGGVVNIITKSGGHGLNAQLSKGSYSTEETRFDYSKSFNEAWAVKTNLSQFDTKGYRDNGDLKKEDALIDAEYSFSDTWKTGITTKTHKDDFGLPGPVSKARYEGSSKDRQSTTAPNDGGKSEEYLTNWRIAYTPESNWAVDTNLYYRERSSETVIGYDAKKRWIDQALKIEDIRHGGDFIINRLDSLGDLESDFNLGSEFFVTDYQQYRNGRTVQDQSQRKIGNISGQAYFTEWALKHEDWNTSIGWRKDRSELEQDESDLKRVCDYKNVIIPPFLFPIPVESNCRKQWNQKVERESVWKNEALEGGFVYHITDHLDGFLGYARSFRNPNLDELLSSDGNLSPQDGEHWDLGFRLDHDPVTLDVTLFTIVTNDEILYGKDIATGLTVNRNAREITRREGAELDFSYAMFDGSVTLHANAGYVEARFDESGAFVPLVPRINTSAGLDWQIDERASFNLTTHYTGERYDGNDESNQMYDKLDSYVTTDAKVTFKHDKAEVFLSLMNMFDEVYSTSGYSGTFYPMPERNLMAGIKFTY